MSPHEIAHKLGGKLVGKPLIKTQICEVIALFPREIIDQIIEHVWFFSSVDDAWAYTFRGDDLKDKHMVFLSDELFKENPVQIKYTIAHEIGHVILDHENSIGRRQTQSEIDQQEKEADQFVKKYLRISN